MSESHRINLSQAGCEVSDWIDYSGSATSSDSELLRSASQHVLQQLDAV